jgi:transposase
MLYLGIDIGKNNHEAGLVEEDGTHRGKSLRFSNDQEGFSSLLRFSRTESRRKTNRCASEWKLRDTTGFLCILSAWKGF